MGWIDTFIGVDANDWMSAGMTSAVAASTTYQMPSLSCNSVAYKADDSNTGEIFVGGQWISGDGTNGYRLNAGQSIATRSSNVDNMYFNAPNADDTIYYLALGTE